MGQQPNYVGGPKWASQADMEIAGAALRLRSHGAIAVSPTSGRWGTAWGDRTAADVEAEALARCQARDARIVLSANGCYLALAQGEDGSFGWAADGNASAASDRALAFCQGANPRIVVFFHTLNGPQRVPAGPRGRRHKSRNRAFVYGSLGVVFGIGAGADAATGHTGLVWSPLAVALIFGTLAVRQARAAKSKN
jgi:hypothetical protein